MMQWSYNVVSAYLLDIGINHLLDLINSNLELIVLLVQTILIIVGAAIS